MGGGNRRKGGEGREQKLRQGRRKMNERRRERRMGLRKRGGGARRRKKGTERRRWSKGGNGGGEEMTRRQERRRCGEGVPESRGEKDGGQENVALVESGFPKGLASLQVPPFHPSHSQPLRHTFSSQDLPDPVYSCMSIPGTHWPKPWIPGASRGNDLWSLSQEPWPQNHSRGLSNSVQF